MTGHIRYQFINYIRSFKIIPPLTIFLAWIIILYFYEGVPILNSYAVTSVAIYLIMTWVSISIFSVEEESEKHILFVQSRSKYRYLWGKWVISFIIALALILYAIVYPILMGNFTEPVKLIHLSLSIYSHVFLASFGILVGSFFSVTSFAGKKYSWLLAISVIIISISYEGIVEKFSLLKWILILFPPVANVIKYLKSDDLIHIGTEFSLLVAFVFIYTSIGFVFVGRMFLNKER